MSRLLFEEIQRFTQVWLWVILVVGTASVLLPLAAALYAELVEGKPFGDNPAPTDTLVILFFIIAAMSTLVIILFWKTRMITRVDRGGVSVRFPPFITRPKVYPRDKIANYSIRKYRPVMEYGGWGIRIGLGGRGKVYNVKGNIGLQLEFHDGRKLLIGTQRGDALARAMQKMMEERQDV